jgi:serine phosphatase RsbU (regulator of sigma subunit)
VQLVLWSVVVLAVITFVFSIFLYKRWKIAKEQKVLIEEKNRLVELKNREILDSISYAKRIQSAILPPEKLVKEFLVNSFILYKPKDIVAGDFYWMETQRDTIIFAAADCTGHGVPGALISVVCHNALNRSVREFGLIEPGAILDKTREIIIEEFAKSEDDVSDGMDISLCALNTETLTVKWSGANNPLWFVLHQSNEVRELKANKQPIGKYSKYEAFDTHTIQLEKGDSLYLFTDGFADQFGGKDAKKYKSKNMKELILRVKDRPMDEQKRLFEEAFDNWKGELEQVDDVCVLGIRV